MNQQYANRKFVLSQAPHHLKVLITVFSIVMLAALGAGVASLWSRTGMTPAGIMAWYRGGEGVFSGGSIASGEARSLGEMFDATRSQLLGSGAALFLLAGLAGLTTLAESRKVTLYALAFAALLLDAAAPWLIRYATGALAPLQIVTTLAVIVSAAVLAIIPAREVWFSGAAAAAAVPDDDAIFPLRPGETRPKRERPRRGERRDGDRRDGDRRPRRQPSRRPVAAGDAVPGGAADPSAQAGADSVSERPGAIADSANDERRSRRRRRWRGRSRPSGAGASTGETIGAGADHGGSSFGGD